MSSHDLDLLVPPNTCNGHVRVEAFMAWISGDDEIAISPPGVQLASLPKREVFLTAITTPVSRRHGPAPGIRREDGMFGRFGDLCVNTHVFPLPTLPSPLTCGGGANRSTKFMISDAPSVINQARVRIPVDHSRFDVRALLAVTPCTGGGSGICVAIYDEQGTEFARAK